MGRGIGRGIARYFLFPIASGAAFLQCLPLVARAQSSGTAEPAIPAPESVLDRLGGPTIALIVAAFVVVALLVWRLWVTVRRERPVTVPSSRTGGRNGSRRGVETTVAPLQQTTDWGQDQNKRAALARSPVTLGRASSELPSLEHAVTQWTISDVVRAQDASAEPPDTLGGSPYRTRANPYFRREQPAMEMEVEEVADTLLQAELLVQLGDPKQAMTLLSHHIRETEKPGPAVWLMLLGLYQSTGREAQYNALAAGFRMLFNAAVPPWAESPDANAPDLGEYPAVLGKLQAEWPTPAARATIQSLLNDDRGGSRQGFSLTAYRELLFLAEILEVLDAMARDDEERRGIRQKLSMPG